MLGRNIASMDNAYIKQQSVKEKVLVRRRKLLFRRLALFGVMAVLVSALLVSTLVSRNAQLAAKKRTKSKASASSKGH